MPEVRGQLQFPTAHTTDAAAPLTLQLPRVSAGNWRAEEDQGAGLREYPCPVHVTSPACPHGLHACACRTSRPDGWPVLRMHAYGVREQGASSVVWLVEDGKKEQFALKVQAIAISIVPTCCVHKSHKKSQLSVHASL